MNENDTIEHCKRCGRDFIAPNESAIRPNQSQFATLHSKAKLLDAMAAELRLYRGFCTQIDAALHNSRLFGPLATYDALFGHHPAE